MEYPSARLYDSTRLDRMTEPNTRREDGLMLLEQMHDALERKP